MESLHKKCKHKYARIDKNKLKKFETYRTKIEKPWVNYTNEKLLKQRVFSLEQSSKKKKTTSCQTLYTKFYTVSEIKKNNYTIYNILQKKKKMKYESS